MARRLRQGAPRNARALRGAREARRIPHAAPWLLPLLANGSPRCSDTGRSAFSSFPASCRCPSRPSSKTSSMSAGACAARIFGSSTTRSASAAVSFFTAGTVSTDRRGAPGAGARISRTPVTQSSRAIRRSSAGSWIPRRGQRASSWSASVDIATEVSWMEMHGRGAGRLPTRCRRAPTIPAKLLRWPAIPPAYRARVWPG